MKTKKTVTLFYRAGEGVDAKLYDEAYNQYDYEANDNLKDLKDMEVIGSWVDGWDFNSVVSNLTKDFNISEELLYKIIDNDIDLSSIIRYNKIDNAREAMTANANFDTENIIKGDLLEFDKEEVSLSSFKYNKKTDRYELEVEVTREGIDIMDEEYTQEDLDNEVEDEYELEWEDLNEFEWSYPVSCKEIYESFKEELEGINIEEEKQKIIKSEIKSNEEAINELKKENAILKSKLK